MLIATHHDNRTTLARGELDASHSATRLGYRQKRGMPTKLISLALTRRAILLVKLIWRYVV